MKVQDEDNFESSCLGYVLTYPCSFSYQCNVASDHGDVNSGQARSSLVGPPVPLQTPHPRHPFIVSVYLLPHERNLSPLTSNLSFLNRFLWKNFLCGTVHNIKSNKLDHCFVLGINLYVLTFGTSRERENSWRVKRTEILHGLRF